MTPTPGDEPAVGGSGGTSAQVTGGRPGTHDAPPVRALRVEVVWSDIAAADTDAIVVGHYIGVLPQYAELALDRLVSGLREGEPGRLVITEMAQRGAIHADLGDVTLWPCADGRLVLLAGMGRPGTFATPQLRRLARTVAQMVGMLPGRESLSTVVIGSGDGNIGLRQAAVTFIAGALEALDADATLRIARLCFVEQRVDRALEVLQALREWSDRRAPAAGGRRVELERTLVEGPGGLVPVDFGCAMLLASLGLPSGEPADTGLLDQLLARLPADLREPVRLRLQRTATDGALSVTEAVPSDRRAGGPAGPGGAAERGLPRAPGIPKLPGVPGVPEVIESLGVHGAPGAPVAPPAPGTPGVPTAPISLHERAMAFRLHEPALPVQEARDTARVTFTRSGDDIRATAITNTTTVTERVLSRRAELVAHAGAHLVRCDRDAFLAQAPQLRRLVLHPDLRDVVQGDKPIVIEVDLPMAQVPWEMLPTGIDDTPLGLHRPLARQLRTPYSPRPFELPRRRPRQALVIGDPAAGRYALAAARGEALAVHRTLQALGVRSTLMVGPPEDGTGAGPVPGHAAANYFEVVDLLLSGRFDLVHFCGHADFEARHADRCGWVFKDRVLTASDLEGMERPPELVFANACLSARLAGPEAPAPTPGPTERGPALSLTPWAGSGPRSGSRSGSESEWELSPLAGSGSRPTSERPAPRRLIGDVAVDDARSQHGVAGLADQFFRQGVRNYIGTAWEVHADPAAAFAGVLYGRLFGADPAAGGPASLGAAVVQARTALFAAAHAVSGPAWSDWAAYQHYGDPAAVFD